jgi:crotonobetainyl-CoA:carnitine CoA-transferase CaiB-like acyl-CoA transferase
MVRMLAGTPVVGSPVRIDGKRADDDRPPPMLGEHTGEVLRELGVTSAELERLTVSGVVGG